MTKNTLNSLVYPASFSKEGERQRDTQRDIFRERERDRERVRERESQTDRQTDRQTQIFSQRQGKRVSEMEFVRDVDSLTDRKGV